MLSTKFQTLFHGLINNNYTLFNACASQKLIFFTVNNHSKMTNDKSDICTSFSNGRKCFVTNKMWFNYNVTNELAQVNICNLLSEFLETVDMHMEDNEEDEQACTDQDLQSPGFYIIFIFNNVFAACI